MGTKPCADCQQPIEFVRKPEGGWRVQNPDGTEHWLICQSEHARYIRVRAGLEPGIFPVSPSRLKLYEQCPLAYKRRYINKEPQEESPAGRMGRALHAREAAKLKGEPEPVPDIAPWMAAEWRELCQVMDGLEWDLTDAAIEEAQTYRWTDRAMQIEYEVRLDFWQYRDDHCIVTDFKSGWAIQNEAQLRTDLQGLSYALVLYQMFPQLEYVRFQQVHLRHGGQVVGVEYEARDLEAFDVLLKAEVGRIMRDVDFKPNPYCTTCPVGAHPAVSYPITLGSGGEILIRPPETQEQAQTLAAYAAAAKRLAEASKAALFDWTDEHGPLGGLGHHSVVNRDCVDIRAFIDLIETEDRIIDPLEDWVRPDGDKLRAVLKSKRKWVGLAESIRPLLRESTATKFEWRKDRSDEQTDDVGAAHSEPAA